MNTFESLKLSPDLIKGLAKDKIEVPTDIQCRAIPTALAHKDLIAQAETGSGKTLAYVLPSFEKIDTASKDLHTIVLAPTHELVVQINNVIKKLSSDSGRPVRSTTIIGQVNKKATN